MRQKSRFLPSVLCLLIVCEAMLFPVSWLISTAWQESGVASLLSADGIRWFIGNYARLLASPYLVWIILAGLSIGIFKGSGLAKPRKGLALQVTIIMLLLQTSAIILLSFIPHAILLSSTGNLLNSSFSAGIIPMLCFVLFVCSITYGVLESEYITLRQLYAVAIHGISISAPYILLYLFAAQLYHSLIYILP